MEVMTLSNALLVIADGLTRDDRVSGFTVSWSRDNYGRFSRNDYVEAMKTVRQFVGLEVEPDDTQR